MTEGRHDMTAQPRLLGGRYQVGELLGYGGMAEVHLGRDLRLGRDVAIKTLRHDLARDATFQLRFRREAQNAASLNHPAIVAVYDTGEEHGPSGEELPYIVMEFVNGRTLKEVLAAEGRLMPRRALEIVGDICSAIEFSHRHARAQPACFGDHLGRRGQRRLGLGIRPHTCVPCHSCIPVRVVQGSNCQVLGKVALLGEDLAGEREPDRNAAHLPYRTPPV